MWPPTWSHQCNYHSLPTVCTMPSRQRHVIQRLLSSDFCYLAAIHSLCVPSTSFSGTSCSFRHVECLIATYFLTHAKIRDQLFIRILRKDGIYVYIYYGITDGLWHAKICLTHPDVSEYLVLYCIKTMFCLCHVLHSTFLKT